MKRVIINAVVIFLVSILLYVIYFSLIDHASGRTPLIHIVEVVLRVLLFPFYFLVKAAVPDELPWKPHLYFLALAINSLCYSVSYDLLSRKLNKLKKAR